MNYTNDNLEEIVTTEPVQASMETTYGLSPQKEKLKEKIMTFAKLPAKWKTKTFSIESSAQIDLASINAWKNKNTIYQTDQLAYLQYARGGYRRADYQN